MTVVSEKLSKRDNTELFSELFTKRDNTELFSELFRALYSLSLMTDDTTVIKEREYRALFRT